MASRDSKDLFGRRCLTDVRDVYEYNAWDNVQWTEEQERLAEEKILLNSTDKLPEDSQERIEILSHEYWDKFYSNHKDRFFKDRNWLEKEFSELFFSTLPNLHIMEVGCGVGNTIFPILRVIKDPGLVIYASDFSVMALSILKKSEGYDPSRCITFQHDITKTDVEIPCPKNSLDFLILVFVLSAVNPELFHCTLQNLVTYLKPGGVLLFRDYGRFDLAQLRFKTGQCLKDNFYMRSDGTRVYFFTQEELHNLFTDVGLEKIQNKVDRRLIVNRKKKLQMYRIWIQCKYKKS
ncbi:Methyltransferase-like protein isoform 1 [Schistosoma japonicum]|uniref:tRNA N(3)-methylcytidine methyltransferase n=1 Tax=Schistosoma japonicum TaxID=6182 RepID=A0A4Z2D9S7_SCHJA|nr:Methyltransferase-like protein isoform 1 [Schistosoma japonicum]